MRPIIQIEDLSKCYALGHGGAPYATVRDDMMKFLRNPFASFRKQTKDLLWAVRDLNLEIYPGEVVGIIGRNGAGKSTMLKILSRITQPTAGRVELYGRVGSLLEVGTGFHPELSGRENIFLNGSILGMKRAEIERRFDEIVDFAEVERFLDTPVKHYSSGMYTKLAFSVAAHLDPEILLVDEVLAVGDASFQKKCLGKMRDVSGGGRTVLFVSHNAAAVEALCSRCIWMRDGQLAGDGEPTDLLRQYLTLDIPPEAAVVSLAEHPGRTSHSQKVLQSVSLLSPNGQPTTIVRTGETLGVQIQFSRSEPLRPVHGFVLKTVTGAPLFGVNNRFVPAPLLPESVTSGVLTCWVDDLPLMPGRYYVDLYFGDEYRDYDVIREATYFDVEASDVFGTGQLCPAGGGPICWGGRYEYQPEGMSAAVTA